MIDLSIGKLQLAYNATYDGGDRAAGLMVDAIAEYGRPRCPECHSAEDVEIRRVVYEYSDVLGPKDDAPHKLVVMASDDDERRYCDKQPEDGQPEWSFFHASCDAVWEIDDDIELEWV